MIKDRVKVLDTAPSNPFSFLTNVKPRTALQNGYSMQQIVHAINQQSAAQAKQLEEF